MATRAQAIAKLAQEKGKDDDAFTSIAYSPETAWIRNRSTGNAWEVSGRELDRTLANPLDYELLVKDKFGNFVGEKGDIVIAGPDEEF
jgi:hypothetical protein